MAEEKKTVIPPTFEPEANADAPGKNKNSQAPEVINNKRRGFVRSAIAAIAAHPFIAGGSAVGTLAVEHGVPATKDAFNATGIFLEAMLNPGIEESADGKTATITINPANVPQFSMEASEVATRISSMGIYKLFLKNRTKVKSAVRDQGTGIYTIVFEEESRK